MSLESKCWEQDQPLAESLESQAFDRVVQTLERSLDTDRDPRAVNWSLEFGYRRGHVPVLFPLTRNFLRYSRGRVPTMEDLCFGVRCAMLLLLRVAQDVACCRLDIAKADRAGVFPAFQAHVRHWVLRWKVLPPTVDVLADLEKWLEATRDTPLPLPTWATSFATGLLGGMNWLPPVAHDVASLERCANITATRDAVTVVFLAALRSTPSWAEFLSREPTE